MKNIQKYVGLMILSCVCNLKDFSQITPDQLKQYISGNKYAGKAEMQSFYSAVKYHTAWIQYENKSDLEIIFHTLDSAANNGLQQNDYNFRLVESCRNNTVSLLTKADSLEAEVQITDAAIHFFHDIAYGNVQPSLQYNGLNYTPDCYNIPAFLAAHISQKRLSFLAGHLSPELPEVSLIESKIASINSIMEDSNFLEVIIDSKKVAGTNKPLILKLYQLGIIDSPYNNLPDITLKGKVKEAQLQFGLMADGELRTTMLQELNIPLSARIQQLNLAVNYYRWLYCLTQSQSVIAVNIPAAYLKVYRNNKVILEMKMVVGKQSTPTPTLAGTINSVVLYPYWHVPYSIATKELLPIIKRNPGYIDEGNYQVLNKAGKIMDPYSLDWQTFSTKYFPYLIRQSTGCDNALGLLKLDFYSPFGVYLHDTPIKSSFMLNKRYFSHGCMRMEKPFELGHLVLKNNSIAIDTLEQKGCLRNQAPITVTADEHMPVIVWYNPVGIDATGRVLFFEDVYGKFDFDRKK